MTTTDMGSCRTPSDRAAAPATSSALTHADGRPMPMQPAQDPRCRRARAATRRAIARPRRGIPAETAGYSLARPRRSCLLFGGGQRGVHHHLSLADDGVEVGLVLEALRVYLVDGLGARGPGREPAAAGDHLEAIDWSIVARGAAQLGGDGLAGHARLLDGSGRQFCQLRFLLGCRRRVDT